MAVTCGVGLDGEYVPSPDERVREQVSAYEASGGVKGATLEGKPVVILTSLGAKSGKVRKNPVIRIVDGDRYVAVASAGGSPKTYFWAVAERFWPHFPEYRRLAQGRDIPIMVLEPVSDV